MKSGLQYDLVSSASLGLISGLASVLWILQVPFGIWLLAAVCAVALSFWLMLGVRRWLIAFVLAALLLPPLPFTWGDSGVHPALIPAACGILSGVLRPGEWRFQPGFLATVLCLFTLALVWSLPLAVLYSGLEVAAGSLARVGLLAIAVYVFFYLAYGPGRTIPAERIVQILFWAGVASAGFAILDFLFQFPAPARFAEQHVWLTGGVYRRAQGVFYEASTLASLCVFLATLTIVIGAQRESRAIGVRPAWLLIAGAVFATALVLSFSRAAVASLFVALAALAWLRRERWGISWRLARLGAASLLAVTAGLALAYRAFPEYLDAYFLKIQHSGEFFFSDPHTVLSQRLGSWTLLVDYLREDPWRALFGIGYKTLPYTSYLGRPVVADNMYLSLLVETGWLGIVSLFLLIAAVLVQSYREARFATSPFRRLCGACMLCFWCGETVQMASGDILTYWRILPAFFAVLAIGARDEDPLPGPVQ